MRRLAAFLALDVGDRRLLRRAAVLLMAVRIALPIASTERLRRWACRPGLGRRPARRTVERIVWAVRTAARVTPGASCLAAALTLQRLLSAEGHGCELHIGVARRGTGLAAHAWVVRDAEILIGGEESASYTGLLAWRGGPAGPA